MSTPSSALPARSIRPLILLALLCLAPVIFAAVMYYLPALGLRPAEQTNYGTLIEPQRPVPADLRLTTLDGAPFTLQSLRGKWVLVSADVASCPPTCARKLFILRNARASQGQNAERIARVWLILDDAPVPEAVREAYAGTVLVRADAHSVAALFAPASVGADGDARALRDPMWVIDPLGNLMLQFPPEADPIGVRKDIVKLLFSSRVG